MGHWDWERLIASERFILEHDALAHVDPWLFHLSIGGIMDHQERCRAYNIPVRKLVCEVLFDLSLHCAPFPGHA